MALGDETIPVSERLEFLQTVLDASPNDEHREELQAMVTEAFEAGYFADLT